MNAAEFFKKMEKENPSTKSRQQLTQLTANVTANATSNATANITANVTSIASANASSNATSNATTNSTGVPTIANVAVVLSPAFSFSDTKLSLDE